MRIIPHIKLFINNFELSDVLYNEILAFYVFYRCLKVSTADGRDTNAAVL